MRIRQRVLQVSTLVLVVCPGRLMACATCFGASDSKMAEGMNMGILFLLGVVGLVVGGITLGFVGLAWRAARVGARSAAAEGSSAEAARSAAM